MQHQGANNFCTTVRFCSSRP